MGDKPKLLWHSNCPWTSTGYGQQTALFTQRLAEHYDLTISSFFGLEGNVLPWNGIAVLPALGERDLGNKTILPHARAMFGEDIRSGLVVTLMDVWVLEAAIWSRLNCASWVPVDHDPAPDPVKAYFQNTGSIPIAMSRFGQDRLGDFDPLYVPHAVDTKAYTPRPTDEARERTGMPKDAFIVGMVAANKGNPSRKCFPEAFRAFKALRDKHPDALLYLHTELTGVFGGVDLPALLSTVGIPDGASISCDQYRAVHFPFPDDTMADIYSSMDVLLMPSAGEGFGIPTIEAQACGVPVIVSDFSAQPELVGAGWTVEGSKSFTPIGSWQVKPDVADIAHALELAYTNARIPEMTSQAREFAEGYDVDHVLSEHMLPALAEVERRFAERGPQTLKAAA